MSARATRSSPSSPDHDGRKMGFVRTWYPSAPDASAVSWRVLLANGEPAVGIAVKSVPPEEFAVAEFELSTRSRDDGVFEFDGLPDRNWRLTAELKANDRNFYAARTETVSGRDIDRLELRFAPPFALTGKVLRAATTTPAATRPIGVMLAPSEGATQMPFGGTKCDGSFRIENLLPGVYRFQPTSPGVPYYLASREMNGRDVTGEWVEIAPGTQPVTITYRADGGTVCGAVEDCGNATVVVAPGEYYAFAFDKGVGMLEFSTFVNRSINQAVRVTVRAGEATDASLKVMRREIY